MIKSISFKKSFCCLILIYMFRLQVFEFLKAKNTIKPNRLHKNNKTFRILQLIITRPGFLRPFIGLYVHTYLLREILQYTHYIMLTMIISSLFAEIMSISYRQNTRKVYFFIPACVLTVCFLLFIDCMIKNKCLAFVLWIDCDDVEFGWVFYFGIFD